ncbi:hypothetical protein [Vineibacter terrae]|uniref:Uncharacterized protein n=1 Tax=Vineibacter terrae TaxID=2586908 RepID=A0A5C8PT33_9HYPH|nr:hypothetical protein [Vineibacter terrae]TXL80476.1 hypothetical protein FHP25_05475 [Vineibacter terrae]HEX2888092.1 hypothetical protein [Vineibacter terrae]
MNGHSHKLDQLAQSALLAVTARAVNVVGVPLMLATILWLFTTVNALEREVAKLPVMFSAMQQQIDAASRRIDGHDQRLQRLEEPYFRNK